MLYHVADVEERGMGAREVVGGTDGERGVLHRHVEAAEGDHFGAVGDVKVVERDFAEVSGSN